MRLAGIGRSLAGADDGSDDPVVLSDRVDGVVVRVGGVVVKAHPEGTDPAALDARLRVAAHPLLHGILVQPLPVGAGALASRVGGRLVTAWPAGEPVRQDDPDAAPWEQAAGLLARLHDPALAAAVPGAAALPAAGGPARVARAMDRLGAGGGPAGAVVRAAFATLPPLAPPAPSTARPAGAAGHGALAHGDWHLGQVVRLPPGVGGGWRLIDVDDLGIGDPVWDLGRPAAWYGAGLLPPDVWERFLGAYRAAGGVAVPPDGDPWPALDLPARALAVQSAALGVAAARRDGRPLDEIETALVDACRRIILQ